MKKTLLIILAIFMMTNIAIAKTDFTCPKEMMPDKVVVLTKGEPFSYPIKEGAIIECYAKRFDGSIDDFKEYNDYFIMRNSNTMNKIYKSEKPKQLKKVDRVSISRDTNILKMYDPLWEGSFRRHVRNIKINTSTSEYLMQGTQDNWMWCRTITSIGYCRVINP